MRAMMHHIDSHCCFAPLRVAGHICGVVVLMYGVPRGYEWYVLILRAIHALALSYLLCMLALAPVVGLWFVMSGVSRSISTVLSITEQMESIAEQTDPTIPIDVSMMELNVLMHQQLERLYRSRWVWQRICRYMCGATSLQLWARFLNGARYDQLTKEQQTLLNKMLNSAGYQRQSPS